MADTSAKTGITRTKDVETVIHQNDEGGGEHHARLSKSLSSWDLMGFGIGIVIGTGIFTLTGVEAKNHAGPAIVLSFAIAGVVSMLAAICYAELAAAVPTAGSSYTYAYTTIGEIFAWIIAWDLILEFALGAAVVSRGWSGYLQQLFGLPEAFFGEENSVINLGAVAIALVLGIIAAVGIRESKLVTNSLVVIKVSVCIFVIASRIFPSTVLCVRMMRSCWPGFWSGLGRCSTASMEMSCSASVVVILDSTPASSATHRRR